MIPLFLLNLPLLIQSEGRSIEREGSLSVTRWKPWGNSRPYLLVYYPPWSLGNPLIRPAVLLGEVLGVGNNFRFFCGRRWSWNPKHPLKHGCFNLTIPNLYMKTGCFTKHPLKTVVWGSRVRCTDHRSKMWDVLPSVFWPMDFPTLKWGSSGFFPFQGVILDIFRRGKSAMFLNVEGQFAIF